MRRIRIFDTTLRDGEQTPGVNLTPEEKLEIARQLERLGVDIVEAGFPVSSESEFQAVAAIAAELREPAVAALARTERADIERAARALERARQPRIHVFTSGSRIHLQHMLRMSEDEVIERSAESVRLAKRYVDDVEFSAQDAGRSERAFIRRLLEAAIEAGATVVNIPDTVGYTTPEEFGALIRDLRATVRGIERVQVSVHCHDDLGLAVANTLAGLAAGADQAEVTVNGIGERAGNASLEEVVMALRTRRDVLGMDTNVRTQEIMATSLLVRRLTGVPVQPNKAVVGEHAFAHESGIHQDGVLKEPSTYEIMRPEDIGLDANRLVLGKHSGRHAFAVRLAALGYSIPRDEITPLFLRFKELTGRQKRISDRDLIGLVEAWRAEAAARDGSAAAKEGA
ncbi:MAG: 2-isopropylmalate synthase [Firmicutes bacterium]|nr:2-isopropylmalate synthase [Bacillota bacterium]